MKRTLILTDIHGCADELMDLFDLVKYHPEADDLICLGDLTDKGPQVGNVVNTFYNLQKINKNVLIIQSNHDDKHVRYQRNEEEFHRTGKKNKIKTYPDFLESRKQLLELDFDAIAWMKTFPLFHKKDNYLFVHGGVVPGLPIEKTDKGVLLHLRNVRKDQNQRWQMLRLEDIQLDDPHWSDVYEGEQGLVFYGHSPFFIEEPRRSKFAIGLDLGCSMGGYLLAYCLETQEFWTVKARKQYAPKFREEWT